jgi:hypothetical protein
MAPVSVALDIARFVVRELRADTEIAALATVTRHAPLADESPILTVRQRGSHLEPSKYNSLSVERVECEAIASTADDVLSILSEVDRVCNRPDASGFEWGDDTGRVRILSSHRLTSPNPSDPDAEPDGMSHGVVTYAVAVA